MDRITGTMAGQRLALGMDRPEWVAADKGWRGFPFERHKVGPTREEVDWSWHSTHVGMCLAGEGNIRVSGEAGDHRYRMQPGIVTLFPQGLGATTIRQLSGHLDVVVVEMSSARIGHLLPETERIRDGLLSPLIGGEDAQIEALLRSMVTEIEAGCISGPIYAESLSLALAVCILARNGPGLVERLAVDDGLSRAQRTRTVDYMTAHMDRKILLTELAANVGVSPRHFLRLFNKSFGVTPHVYLTGLRMQRARELLSQRSTSIAEVAFTLGFNSQSHFTEVFHRSTGITPQRYRREQ